MIFIKNHGKLLLDRGYHIGIETHWNVKKKQTGNPTMDKAVIKIETYWNDRENKMGKINVDSLIQIFEEANQNFLEKNQLLFEAEVSERTLCGALMIEIHDIIRSREEYHGYFVDVEYNRNRGNQIAPHKKMIKKLDRKNTVISCDLILHSRGQNIKEDNLIELEMKKADRREDEKESDRERLRKITEPVNEIFIKKEKLPPYVCGYKLGIYYEIDFKEKIIYIEYYCAGKRILSKRVDF